MIISSLDTAHDVLRECLKQADDVVGFTGAGISTECGVPDFRSPNSPWMKNKPIDFSDFMSSPEMRIEAWRRKFTMDDMYQDKMKPGRGHRALAALTASGKMSALITQNIDGLHHASGIEPHRIIELHGNGTYAKCLSCGQRHELRDVRKRFEVLGTAPECDCGGPVKSATVSFGQAMPREEMRRATQASGECDLFLAIGSSLVVYPAAGLPMLAKQNGATLIIINGEATPLDGEADVVLRGDIGAILEPFGEAAH